MSNEIGGGTCSGQGSGSQRSFVDRTFVVDGLAAGVFGGNEPEDRRDGVRDAGQLVGHAVLLVVVREPVALQPVDLDAGFGRLCYQADV